jgi:hypothetical protein
MRTDDHRSCLLVICNLTNPIAHPRFKPGSIFKEAVKFMIDLLMHVALCAVAHLMLQLRALCLHVLLCILPQYKLTEPSPVDAHLCCCHSFAVQLGEFGLDTLRFLLLDRIHRCVSKSCIHAWQRLCAGPADTVHNMNGVPCSTFTSSSLCLASVSH